MDRDQAYKEMMAWATGAKSNLNTFIGLNGDRAWELAMCAVADAAEVEKWSHVVRAASPDGRRDG